LLSLSVLVCSSLYATIAPSRSSEGKGLLLDPLEEQVADDLLQGTLELLVLKALSLEPMHGWGIGNRIDQLSKDVFRVHQGSLYPALQRMLRKGWIRSEWRTSENNRRARYYLLT